MFIHYRTQGIFIKREERGEADILFTVYTKDFGKVLILAKAARKINSKLRAGARELCLSEIEFIQGRSYKTLTDSILIDNFSEIRKDLDKTETVFQVCHVLDILITKEEKDDQIWDLLNEAFNKLNLSYKLQITSYKIYYFFLWNLLAVLGYQLDFYKCAVCQKNLEPFNLYFSPKQGGIVCQKCKEKSSKKITSEIIKILRVILKKDWSLLLKLKIDEENQKILKEVSQEYLSYFSDNC